MDPIIALKQSALMMSEFGSNTDVDLALTASDDACSEESAPGAAAPAAGAPQSSHSTDQGRRRKRMSPVRLRRFARGDMAQVGELLRRFHADTLFASHPFSHARLARKAEAFFDGGGASEAIVAEQLSNDNA